MAGSSVRSRRKAGTRLARRPKPRTARVPSPRPSLPSAGSGLAPGAQTLTPCLAVANVAASVQFLERVLGFSRGVTLDGGESGMRYAEMRHEGMAVILVRRDDVSAPGGGAPALYAYVPDVDRAAAMARESGVAASEVQDRPWGDRVAEVTDPDGYRWLLATFRKLAPFGP